MIGNPYHLQFITMDMYKEIIFYDALLIPSPKQPNSDIDVYLESLIDELKDLWIETYVALRN